VREGAIDPLWIPSTAKLGALSAPSWLPIELEWNAGWLYRGVAETGLVAGPGVVPSIARTWYL
jgi:hypothetical protein